MKTTQRLITLLTLILATSHTNADEGMWTLYNLPDAVYAQMQGEGFQLTKSSLYNDSASLANSVVSFCGYCTATVVSPTGLVLTNHHCGFESIRSHSTIENDYMLHGFCANTYAEELPNENMFVSFMIGQEDVTQRLRDMGYDTASPGRRDALIDSLAMTLTSQAMARDSSLYVEIDAFYEGNAFIATTYQSYNDVRLVFAPTKSMGKFGGETDNWMWPRQTCDFSVFRIYVDPKTGGPADYSPDNVPMQPKSWISVSTEGYRNGDFAMVMGFPGSTRRYLSSYGIQARRDALNDPMQQVRGVKQQVMRRHMDADEAVRIKYDSKYAQSSNYWKNSIGMNKCIDSIGIIQQKQAHEERIQHYLADHPEAMMPAMDATLANNATAGTPQQLDFTLLQRLYERSNEARRAYTFFQETFEKRSGNELPVRASRYADGLPDEQTTTSHKGEYVEFPDNSDQWDAALDKDAFAVMLKNYREQVPAKYQPDIYTTIDSDFHGDYHAYVDHVWSTSRLMKSNVRIPVRMTKKLRRDPGIQLAMALAKTRTEITTVLHDVADSIEEQERLLCLAKVRMEQDMPHYSDANLTMRLTYGQVGGYSMNGNDSGYYTTAASILEKMKRGNDVSDYFAEPELQQLMAATDFGSLRDSVSGTLNLCFLTNNDITGGNSGSPVLDAHGRLIGLAFDGNWDSLSSDIFFDKTLARCIAVDIRYVMYIISKWGHADRLIEEMTER